MKTSPKKIFFFGTPSIATPSLEALHNDPNIEIVGVGVFPDKKVGRKRILTPCPTKQKAGELNLPIVEIATKQDLENTIATTDFDLGIVIAFGIIFTDKALTKTIQNNENKHIPIINVHFSLLPLYRGASPVQSAIKNGEKHSGITIQRMVKELDAGDILFQESSPLPDDTTTSKTFATYAQKTAQILPHFTHQYLEGSITPIPQNPSQATFCGKFTKADGAINPQTQTAQEIDNTARAFDIFPGIYIPTEKGNIKLTKTSLKHTEKSLLLHCKNNTKLCVTELQIPGKKPSNAQDAFRGNPDFFTTLGFSL